jgi:hypothetical protein
LVSVPVPYGKDSSDPVVIGRLKDPFAEMVILVVLLKVNDISGLPAESLNVRIEDVPTGYNSVDGVDNRDATPEERELILNEVHKLIKDLNNCAFRAKELEWYMSGDTGATSYLKRLKDKDLI